MPLRKVFQSATLQAVNALLLVVQRVNGRVGAVDDFIRQVELKVDRRPRHRIPVVERVTIEHAAGEQHFIAETAFCAGADVVDVAVLQRFKQCAVTPAGTPVRPYIKRYDIGGTMLLDPGSFARDDWNGPAMENSLAGISGASTPAKTVLFFVATQSLIGGDRCGDKEVNQLPGEV